MVFNRAIEHDPVIYANPDHFDPERFLDDKGQLRSDYETSVFGFGKVSAGDVRHDYLPLREPRFLISVPSVPRCLVCRTNALDRDS